MKNNFYLAPSSEWWGVQFYGDNSIVQFLSLECAIGICLHKIALLAFSGDFAIENKTQNNDFCIRHSIFK